MIHILLYKINEFDFLSDPVFFFASIELKCHQETLFRPAFCCTVYIAFTAHTVYNVYSLQTAVHNLKSIICTYILLKFEKHGHSILKAV